MKTPTTSYRDICIAHERVSINKHRHKSAVRSASAEAAVQCDFTFKTVNSNSNSAADLPTPSEHQIHLFLCYFREIEFERTRVFGLRFNCRKTTKIY